MKEIKEEKDYDKLYSEIKRKGINYVLHGNETNEIFKNYSEEDVIIYMYLIAIDEEDLSALTKLNNKYQQKNDIILNFYKRKLLNQERIKKIIKLENDNCNFIISGDFLVSLIDNGDDQLFKNIYNNFIYDNKFIKSLLYLYKNYAKDKNTNFSLNSKLEKIITKELGKIDLNKTNSDNTCNSLICACEKRNETMVKFLIKNGVEINKIIDRVYIPILKASISGNLNIVKLLIENGANVNIEDYYGNNPLIEASIHGYIEIAKLLIENGTDVNKENRHGYTPLAWACIYGHVNIVKFLIENGADVNKENVNGENPLMYAYNSGYENIIKTLIEYGANVNKIDPMPVVINVRILLNF